uniref:PIF1/LRR1 pleckstrin homology domain-containing protein n=1 Tax=Coturnix japonica TaxID=93934 RepID=A0A8C2T2M1_COTJA
MKLHCDVEVQSRLLPTCGLTGRGRPSRALLALGRQPGRARGGVCLMVCTARDRAGVRYQVKDNVERFFTRFVEEGKATVRLKEPPVDVCLSKVRVGTGTNNELLMPCSCFPAGKCQQSKDFPFSCETGSPRDRCRCSPTLSFGTGKDLRS